ncbi:hypothetical protein [Rhodococcus sp. ACT016]|uniref:hypothetical protein n=1 Tax=Rhodococcus sp. ACT016 TaxID=3134808 RepID=UPI003D293FCB
MTACGHKKCENESDAEKAGLAAASQVLNDSGLQRVCENEADGPVPDYRSARHTVEVKQLASTSYEALRRASSKNSGIHPVPALTKTWMISTDATASSFAIRHDVKAPFFPKLPKKLGPLLRELEDRGIFSYRELVKIGNRERFKASATGSPEPALELARRIVAILGDNPTCEAIDSEGSERLPKGIMLTRKESGSRVPDLNVTVRDVVQNWIESDSENMRASMSREGNLQIRCGVVVAPGYGYGFKIMRALGVDFPELSDVPTDPLKLPDELDILIIVAADQVISFRKSPGKWERTQLATIPLTG